MTDPQWWSHPVQHARLSIFLAETATIMAVGWMLQHNRERQRDRMLQAERLRVMRVTQRTVNDIVNNSLNQVQSLRFTAEGHVPDASIVLFDETMEHTVNKLRALGNMTTYAEKPMAMGMGLDDSNL